MDLLLKMNNFHQQEELKKPSHHVRGSRDHDDGVNFAQTQEGDTREKCGDDRVQMLVDRSVNSLPPMLRQSSYANTVQQRGGPHHQKKDRKPKSRVHLSPTTDAGNISDAN